MHGVTNRSEWMQVLEAIKEGAGSYTNQYDYPIQTWINLVEAADNLRGVPVEFIATGAEAIYRILLTKVEDRLEIERIAEEANLLAFIPDEDSIMEAMSHLLIIAN